MRFYKFCLELPFENVFLATSSILKRPFKKKTAFNRGLKKNPYKFSFFKHFFHLLEYKMKCNQIQICQCGPLCPILSSSLTLLYLCCCFFSIEKLSSCNRFLKFLNANCIWSTHILFISTFIKFITFTPIRHHHHCACTYDFF